MRQCKDIPTEPILEFIFRRQEHDARDSCNWFGVEHENTVRHAMPDGFSLPDKLVLAKMRQLIARDLVDGCACGCSGCFQLTEKGRLHLAASRERDLDVSSSSSACSPGNQQKAGGEGK